MSKTAAWSSKIKGVRYEFSYARKGGKHTITVDNAPIEVKGSFMSVILGFDEAFTFDGTEARLVVGKTPDVAIDGTFLRSGKKYVQRPAWVMAFAVLNLLIPIISLGGALPAALGLIGVMACVGISKAEMPIAVRLILCLIVTGAVWAAWYFMAFLVKAVIYD